MTDQNIAFDFDSFETHWKNYTEDQKAEILGNIENLGPSLAILPVLASINSYHFTIRNNARKSLETIQIKINSIIFQSL